MGKKKHNSKPTTTAPTTINSTPPGHKKDTSSTPFPDAYDPPSVEAAWGEWWEANGHFKPKEDSKEHVIMLLPPPNVTGTLHIGHSLMCAIEDAIMRWHRMNGRSVLWVPGVDHAGIATQVAVEKKIWKEGQLTRHDLGREKFVEEVWKWKNEKGDTINQQTRRMGCSLDWSRFTFTMDEKVCNAVIEAFCRLNHKGVIYRANRLVNWSCILNTAISNEEVEDLELEKPEFIKVPGYDKKIEFGVIHHFAYQFADSKDGEEIEVATTRIETMLGDVAVAVHPEDPRYSKFIGRKLKHPFHEDRLLEVIGDPILVKDMKFGTGAVKVTPAHDVNDFDCGRRNNLESINILTDDGKINSNGGKFAGMKRYDARDAIIQELSALGLFRGKQPNKMTLKLCHRSQDIIEPILKPQWWVSCKEAARQSIQAVRNGDLAIIPQNYEKIWFHWMENIQDWCVSRQLWWGHRIPAYRILIDGSRAEDDCDASRWVVAKLTEDALRLAKERFPSGNITVQQDDDVLDTWFSAGLLPFAAFGWPNQTEDLKKFYPTSILETGHDILFFWVARMVMLGLELTEKLPFKTVFLHPMVRDKYGKKMSKLKGNVIDPIDVMESCSLETLIAKIHKSNLSADEVDISIKGLKKAYPKGLPECGADALRFSLLDYMVQERSINLDVDRVFGYRQFCNKLWQGTKFVTSHFGSDFKEQPIDLDSLNLADRWILSRLANAVKLCDQGFKEYKFSLCTSAIFDFWTKEFCPVYLEAVKHILSSGDEESKDRVKNIMYRCTDWTLKLTHPIMPFVTEELWQRLPRSNENESIMIQKYPELCPQWSDMNAENQMTQILSIVHSLNSLKSGLDINKSSRPTCYIRGGSDHLHMEAVWIIEALGKAEKVTLLSTNEAIPAGCLSSVVSSQITLYLQTDGLVNVEKQIEKIVKQLDTLDKWIANKEKQTQQSQYKAKTPAEIQEKHMQELKEKCIERENLKLSLKKLQELLPKSFAQRNWLPILLITTSIAVIGIAIFRRKS